MKYYTTVKNTEAECYALIWNASKDIVLNNKKTRSLYRFYTLWILYSYNKKTF